MSRKEGDLCPFCEKGHLTVDSDRLIRTDEGGSSASHRTWLCDTCGKTSKDHVRGIIENIDTSEQVDAKKN